MPHTTNRHEQERIRQNLVYLRHLLQELFDAGEHDLAVACSEELVRHAKQTRQHSLLADPSLRSVTTPA